MGYVSNRESCCLAGGQESRRRFVRECLNIIEKKTSIEDRGGSAEVRSRLKIDCSNIKPNCYLTQQEYKVVTLLLEGCKYKQIAKSCGLSVRTVEFYMANVKKKFEVNRKAELVKLFTS